MSQQHLFVMDPLETLNLPLDSSLRMMFALAALGHKVLHCEPRHLVLSTTVGARALCREVTFGQGPEDFSTGPEKFLYLADFSAIHMRKDPPYDLDYVAATWLLDAAARVTKVYNHPESLRRYNEKLAIFRFPRDIRPALVTSEPETIVAFIASECGGDAVLKPLTLFGGRGVHRVRLAQDRHTGSGLMAMPELFDFLKKETGEGRHLRLVQPFDSAILEGEVRAFTAFGEPITWCLKRPAPGQFLANTRAGAQLLAYTPTAEEVERVRRISAEFLKDGVVFIGFDLIGGFVSEINLTSPRLLQAPGEDGQESYRRIAELIVRDVNSKTETNVSR